MFIKITREINFRAVIFMNSEAEKRCIELGKYIADTKSTVRQTSAMYGISKSTVHMDVTKRLRKISPSLAKEVNEVLQQNKAVRHIRGGEATKEKYLHLKTKCK